MRRAARAAVLSAMSARIRLRSIVRSESWDTLDLAVAWRGGVGEDSEGAIGAAMGETGRTDETAETAMGSAKRIGALRGDGGSATACDGVGTAFALTSAAGCSAASR